MTQICADPVLNAAVKDFLVYQDDARQRIKRRAAWRISNAVQCFAVAFVLSVMASVFGWNLVVMFFVLLGLTILALRPLFGDAGPSLHEDMAGMLQKLNFPEVVVQHLQTSTLKTSDEVFEMGGYAFFHHDVQRVSDGLWLRTFWLTGSKKVVRVDLQAWRWDQPLEFHPVVCREEDRRTVLELYPDRYVDVYGAPKVVA